jgi:hypothetical protein
MRIYEEKCRARYEGSEKKERKLKAIKLDEILKDRKIPYGTFLQSQTNVSRRHSLLMLKYLKFNFITYIEKFVVYFSTSKKYGKIILFLFILYY